eukprot:353858-Chlamydomonas_euryale.AAC.3
MPVALCVVPNHVLTHKKLKRICIDGWMDVWQLRHQDMPTSWSTQQHSRYANMLGWHTLRLPLLTGTSGGFLSELVWARAWAGWRADGGAYKHIEYSRQACTTTSVRRRPRRHANTLADCPMHVPVSHADRAAEAAVGQVLTSVTWTHSPVSRNAPDQPSPSQPCPRRSRSEVGDAAPHLRRAVTVRRAGSGAAWATARRSSNGCSRTLWRRLAGARTLGIVIARWSPLARTLPPARDPNCERSLWPELCRCVSPRRCTRARDDVRACVWAAFQCAVGSAQVPRQTMVFSPNTTETSEFGTCGILVGNARANNVRGS